MNIWVPRIAVIVAWICFHVSDNWAQDFEHEPIRYSTAVADNPVTQLISRLDGGHVDTNFEDRFGYLNSLLKELSVPVSSQVLVFSKTSLQRQRITPRTPRAIYFSDDVYVGFCQRGDVLEVSTADPQLGAVFYTVDQSRKTIMKVVRQNDNCLTCHATSHTRGVPGHLVRSVYSDEAGFPVLSMGTHRIDHTSPLAHRWGGWYVTGTHGSQTHLGNLVLTGNKERRTVDNASGQNQLELNSRFQTSDYLSPHSDLIALMVLEHQTEAHNVLTRANFLTREALAAETRLNQELGEPEGHRWVSTTTRISSACEALVRYLLFCDEAPLTARLQGTSEFATDFSSRGLRDPMGRSLRDFDLERRMFRYPCSYLIYSRSFEELPTEARNFIWRRLREVLSGTDQQPKFAHLSPADRTAIREILVATKPNLPIDWQEFR